MTFKVKSKKVKEKRQNKIEYNVMYNVGKAKYFVSYYTGKRHKDGSKFFDIAIFKNKKKMEEFITELNNKNLRQ